MKISLSKSSSRSIFQRAQLDHNLSHSPVTSCKIIPLHMQVIKQSSSFDTESAHRLWWQDKSNPTTHTIPAYLGKSDSSATNGEGCAVKATCPRLWGIHIMENSDSPPLGWFSTQGREAKGLLPLNCGYWVPTQSICTIALIQRSCLLLPKPREAHVGHGCATAPSHTITSTSPKAGWLLLVEVWGCFLLQPVQEGSQLVWDCVSSSILIHMDVGTTACRAMASLGRVETPSPRKCRCSIISSPGSAPGNLPLHLPPFPQYNPTYFTAQLRGKHQAPDFKRTFQVSLCINCKTWAKPRDSFRL